MSNVSVKTNPVVFFLSEDGAEIKRQVCQRRITQALVDVYIANMISYDNHWQSLQFLQAHDLSRKCVKKKWIGTKCLLKRFVRWLRRLKAKQLKENTWKTDITLAKRGLFLQKSELKCCWNGLLVAGFPKKKMRKFNIFNVSFLCSARSSLSHRRFGLAW